MEARIRQRQLPLISTIAKAGLSIEEVRFGKGPEFVMQSEKEGTMVKGIFHREMYEKLKANGTEFLSEPQLMGDSSFVCFKDPDGTILELIQFKGAAQHA
jgi:hypothetical protein